MLARCLLIWLYYLLSPSGSTLLLWWHWLGGFFVYLFVLFFLVFVFVEMGQCCPVFRTISIALWLGAWST